jgi:hypothetical protein
MSNINPAALSKINWTNALAAVVALSAALGFVIPQEYQDLAIKAVAVGAPVLTIILRTFFTAKKP